MIRRGTILGLLILLFGFVSIPAVQAGNAKLEELITKLRENPREDVNIRVEIIKYVQKMKVKPALPDGLDQAMGKAKYIMNNGEGQEAFAKAANAYREASLLAPWVADIYYNMGTLREKAGQTSNALIDYSLYLLARPNAPDKKAIKEKIGAMEYASQTTFKDILSPGHGLMVLIPAGEFTMGSPVSTGGMNEQPQHTVYLDAFYMDKKPVTHQQWVEFCKATGRAMPADGGPRYPIFNVTWAEANAYAQWAGKRLPTEAEYEKAMRGGTTTKWFCGDDPSQLVNYAWYGANSNMQIHEVGLLRPNPYGLYDIIGNVNEWCSDWYGDQYYKVSPGENPQGPEKGGDKVLRGGWSYSEPNNIRSAYRIRNNPTWTHGDNGDWFGFRCVMDPSPDDPAVKNSQKSAEAQ